VLAALLGSAFGLPALCFAFAPHSTGRVVLAWSAFYWTPLALGLAWLAWTNYAFTSALDGDTLSVFTLRGRIRIDLQRIESMRSLSLWGQYGAAHAFRLRTYDGQRATVLVASRLTSLNRRNVARAQQLRDALAVHADVADARGRSWLGAGPAPSRLVAARHVLAMMALYFVVVLASLLALAGFITVATG
jgi:hypothetical protein